MDLINVLFDLEQLKKSHYIGLSKLCCLKCHLAIRGVNNPDVFMLSKKTELNDGAFVESLLPGKAIALIRDGEENELYIFTNEKKWLKKKYDFLRDDINFKDIPQKPTCMNDDNMIQIIIENVANEVLLNNGNLLTRGAHNWYKESAIWKFPIQSSNRDSQPYTNKIETYVDKAGKTYPGIDPQFWHYPSPNKVTVEVVMDEYNSMLDKALQFDDITKSDKMQIEIFRKLSCDYSFLSFIFKKNTFNKADMFLKVFEAYLTIYKELNNPNTHQTTMPQGKILEEEKIENFCDGFFSFLRKEAIVGKNMSESIDKVIADVFSGDIDKFKQQLISQINIKQKAPNAPHQYSWISKPQITTQTVPWLKKRQISHTPVTPPPSPFKATRPSVNTLSSPNSESIPKSISSTITAEQQKAIEIKHEAARERRSQKQSERSYSTASIYSSNNTVRESRTFTTTPTATQQSEYGTMSHLTTPVISPITSPSSDASISNKRTRHPTPTSSTEPSPEHKKPKQDDITDKQTEIKLGSPVRTTSSNALIDVNEKKVPPHVKKQIESTISKYREKNQYSQRNSEYYEKESTTSSNERKGSTKPLFLYANSEASLTRNNINKLAKKQQTESNNLLKHSREDETKKSSKIDSEKYK